MLSHELLKENYGEERADKIVTLICKLAVELVAEQDEEQLTLWNDIKTSRAQELEKLNNKEEFLEKITKEKKQITRQIEKIDKLINNKELLQQEYEFRNENLPNKEKIFSIKHLVNHLEIERQEQVDKLKKCNFLIDPKGYVLRKEEVTKKMQFLNQLELEQIKKNIQDSNLNKNEINKTIRQEMRHSLVDLCLLFLSCFQINIVKTQNRHEILKYIYQLRYYCFLPFDENGTPLRELAILKNEFEKTIKLILQKAKKLDIIDEITEDEQVNYEIISKIFSSKMIDLNNMNIETKVENGKLFVEYYDTNVLETKIEVHSDKTVKLKKKVRLFNY